jgi:hypothetical protein
MAHNFNRWRFATHRGVFQRQHAQCRIREILVDQLRHKMVRLATLAPGPELVEHPRATLEDLRFFSTVPSRARGLLEAVSLPPREILSSLPHHASAELPGDWVGRSEKLDSWTA